MVRSHPNLGVLWYKATHFRGVAGNCRLVGPTDFIRGISAGKLDSFRLDLSDARGSVINDYFITSSTGNPSSKYDHRHYCVTLEIQRKYKDLYRKKPIVSVTYENERISIKNSLPYLKCVLRLLCGPRADLWAPFYGL